MTNCRPSRILLASSSSWADRLETLLERYGLQHLAAELRQRVLPAIALSLTSRTTTRSLLGGAPLVPSDFQWPWYTPPVPEHPPAALARLGLPAPPDPTPRALDFLLQLDLADLRDFPAARDLPRSGLLTFFYDRENQPWGYDPAHQDGFRVLLFEDSGLVARLPPTHTLGVRGIAFAHSETLPHFGSRAYEDLESCADLPDAYVEFVHEFERRAYQDDGGLHRMFGHSANVQGDMQLEAQLVSNGLYCGDSSGYQDPRALFLGPGAADWVLLLQLDSDDDARMMWGDAGMLYFWIRRTDLAARRFERVWATLQCG